jgi:hypothetical protein
MQGVLRNKLAQQSISLGLKGMGILKIIEWRWVKYEKPDTTEE